MLLKNLTSVISQRLFIVYFLLGVCIILTPSYFFLDFELVIGNLGVTFLWAEVILTIISAVLFGLFLATIMHKIRYFSPKAGAEGVAGGVFVMIVSGCPSCSITLAYYVGLASIISTLPYHGLELKVLGIVLITYAIYDNLKYLEVCKIKKQNIITKLKNKLFKKSA